MHNNKKAMKVGQDFKKIRFDFSDFKRIYKLEKKEKREKNRYIIEKICLRY